MDITARYAQQLNKDNLQENTINSYLSDVRQLLAWKAKFAPNSPLDDKVLAQYLRAASFSKSKHTMRRKTISLSKFLIWLANTNSSSDSGQNTKGPVNDKVKYLVSAVFSILLLVSLFTLGTDSHITSWEDQEHTALDNNDVPRQVSVERPIDIIVDGVEVAVSGYEIQAPMQDPADIVLSLQDTFEKDSENTLESLSPVGGTEQIEKGNTYTIILHESIDEDSLITVTATAPTKGETLFIQSQGEGYAVIAIEEPIDRPLPFNWIAI